MRKRSSVQIAKNRLRNLLVSDRIHCKSTDYDYICNDLYRVLSKYMEITDDKFDVKITRSYIHITLWEKNIETDKI